jgi:hypothetical protein
MKIHITHAAMAITLGTVMAGSSLAQAAALPPVHIAGQVEYLSGGIGKDEATAIQGASKQWPLTLEFARNTQPHAEFVANVQVVVHDNKGRAALDTNSDGPFLLARLAPGRYAVDATLAGKTLHKEVLVTTGHPAKATFLWPANSAKSAA